MEEVKSCRGPILIGIMTDRLDTLEPVLPTYDYDSIFKTNIQPTDCNQPVYKHCIATNAFLAVFREERRLLLALAWRRGALIENKKTQILFMRRDREREKH